LSFFFLGAFTYKVNLIEDSPSCFINLINQTEEQAFLLQVSDDPIRTPKGQRFIADVVNISLNGDWVNTVGKVIVYHKGEIQFNYLDQFISTKKPEEFRKIRNPNEFDFAKHYKQKQIFKQLYLSDVDINSKKSIENFSLKKIAIQLKNQFIERVENFDFHKGSSGIITALVTGDQRLTESEVKSDFISTGTMHVLAVSGLHLGILYYAVTLLTGFFTRFKKGKWIQFVVILFVIWFYAFFTGFSPSVSRAATMFSLIGLGQLVTRRVFSINILCASALFMLAYNPMLIYSIGMQLSYSALTGILVLTPLLQKLIFFNSSFLNKAYSICCATFAAQLFTLPFSLFHFHQFPTYFLLANLVAIPLIGIIAAGSFLSFIAGLVPIFQKIIWFLLDYVVLILNKFISLISSLPTSTIRFIPFDEWMLFISILFLVLLIVGTLKFSPMHFYVGSILIFCLFTWPVIRPIFSQVSELTIFYHKNDLMIQVRQKNLVEKIYFNSLSKNLDELSNQNPEFNRVEKTYVLKSDSNVVLHIKNLGTLRVIDEDKCRIDSSAFIHIVHNPQHLPLLTTTDLPKSLFVFSAKEYTPIKFKWLYYLRKNKALIYEIRREGYYNLKF
jgi:competence protein ComEC